MRNVPGNGQDTVDGLYQDAYQVTFTWDNNWFHNPGEGCSVQEPTAKQLSYVKKRMVRKTTSNLQKY